MADIKCTHALDEVCWSERDTYDSKGNLVTKRAIPMCTHKADRKKQIEEAANYVWLILKGAIRLFIVFPATAIGLMLIAPLVLLAAIGEDDV